MSIHEQTRRAHEVLDGMSAGRILSKENEQLLRSFLPEPPKQKTLADMTAEERANCVGMWCDNLVSTADNPKPEVLACVQGEQCWIIHTDLHGEWSRFPLDSVSPRHDLPRAWTPDGEPIPGEWEDGHVFVSYDEPDPWIVKDTVSIEGLSEGGMSYYEEPPNGIVVELDRFGEGEGKARRWVGEWEQIDG